MRIAYLVALFVTGGAASSLLGWGCTVPGLQRLFWCLLFIVAVVAVVAVVGDEPLQKWLKVFPQEYWGLVLFSVAAFMVGQVVLWSTEILWR
jgi:hypothetical protein